MQNFFKQKTELKPSLFDKITVMDTVLWRPNSPYFTIHFKDGSKFNFSRKTFGDVNYALKDKTILAKEQTAEIVKYLTEIRGDSNILYKENDSDLA
jgi:hypothetical protein